MKSTNKWQDSYDEIPIPDHLDTLIRSTIHQAQKERRKKKRLLQTTLTLVASLFLTISLLNVSPTFATAVANVPGFQSIVNILTVQTHQVETANMRAEIVVPQVRTIEHPKLEQFLNEKYIAEGEALYQSFEQQMDDLGKEGFLSVDAGYDVLMEDEQLLVIRRFESESIGSSSLQLSHDTIDKEMGIVLTLPSLFIDDTYIQVISHYLAEELAHTYGVVLTEQELASFVIDAEQDFYIAEDRTLTISFDKYEVAMGAAGPTAVTIPTEIIQPLLVSNHYIHAN